VILMTIPTFGSRHKSTNRQKNRQQHQDMKRLHCHTLFDITTGIPFFFYYVVVLVLLE
jgi:hypothetical protein